MVVKRIGNLSLGKVMGAVYALLGLVIGAIYALFALLFGVFNTVVAYGAFGMALEVWEVSRVSSVAASAPHPITMFEISACVPSRMGGPQYPVPGLT